MHARQTVDSWLSQINPEDASLVLDTHGQCQLMRSRDELCTVFVPAQTSESFVLYSHVWHLTEALETQQYESLLGLNMLGIKTLGCTLGLDAHFRSLLLSYPQDLAGCDLERFCSVVDNFFSAAATVRREIEAILNARTARSTAAAPALDSLGHLQRLRIAETAETDSRSPR